MDKIKPNPEYDSYIVSMTQSPLYKKLLEKNQFNYGGKRILEVGKYNKENIKSYEEVKEYMQTHNKKFRVALDVGARWGEWTRLMQDDFWHIYCFEPVKKNIKSLTKIVI